MISTKKQPLLPLLKSAGRIFLATALLLTLTGCQVSEQTTEPQLMAMAAYNCDVRHGFSSSFSVDTAAVKARISDIEKQITAIQQNIAARQNEIAELNDNAVKSEEQQRLEQEIASLQEQISVLQSELHEMQLELQALQSSQKSDAIIALENEIKSLQAQASTLQNTLNGLKRELSESSGDVQTMVGFIEYVKISGTELAADITVTNPVSSSQYKVVGVISNIFWDGGYAEPISFSCQVSDTNQSLLTKLAHSSLSNTDVEFVFTVYDYDISAKEYYKCFHTNSEKLYGAIGKSGGDLFFQVEADPSAEVASPKNFTFNLGVIPKNHSQQIYMAVSVTDQMTKKWGVEVTQ